MKKYLCLLWMIACVITLPACGDDDDDIEEYEAWKLENEEVINKLIYNAEYSRLMSPTNAGYIYYKVLKKGEGTEPIYYNSSVKAYFSRYTLNNDTPFESFESPYDDPKTFELKERIEGERTALQNMKVGDRWEVWIPYELAYGSSGYTKTVNNIIEYKILPYSTLKVEIEVVEITQH